MDQNQFMPMTKKDFWEIYWFTPLQMVTLINPKSTDYKFMVEGRNFLIRAGKSEKMPGTVANIYLSQMSRIMAQDEDKMQHMSDFLLMKQYYDDLIVDVQSLIQEVNNVPEYLARVPDSMRAPAAPDTPPWQQTPNSIPDTNSDMTNTWGNQPKEAPVAAPVVSETPKEVEPKTKEFEYEGAKYKMVIDKNDQETFFKDGRRVSGADYALAASMV